MAAAQIERERRQQHSQHSQQNRHSQHSQQTPGAMGTSASAPATIFPSLTPNGTMVATASATSAASAASPEPNRMTNAGVMAEMARFREEQKASHHKDKRARAKKKTGLELGDPYASPNKSTTKGGYPKHTPIRQRKNRRSRFPAV
jgi:hypothetical protein